MSSELCIVRLCTNRVLNLVIEYAAERKLATGFKINEITNLGVLQMCFKLFVVVVGGGGGGLFLFNLWVLD